MSTSLPIAWSVGLLAVIILGTTLVLWPRTRGMQPPRSFEVSLRWSGRGYLPGHMRRALLLTALGILIGMTAVGSLANLWTHNWVVDLIFPAMALPVVAMGLWPQSLGGTVYANPDEFFFQATGFWALAGLPARFHWSDIAEWTDDGACVDCLARGGGRRWRIYLPGVPPEYRTQVNTWLASGGVAMKTGARI